MRPAIASPRSSQPRPLSLQEQPGGGGLGRCRSHRRFPRAGWRTATAPWEPWPAPAAAPRGPGRSAGEAAAPGARPGAARRASKSRLPAPPPSGARTMAGDAR